MLVKSNDISISVPMAAKLRCSASKPDCAYQVDLLLGTARRWTRPLAKIEDLVDGCRTFLPGC
jgi:hypothetical protein